MTQQSTWVLFDLYRWYQLLQLKVIILHQGSGYEPFLRPEVPEKESCQVPTGICSENFLSLLQGDLASFTRFPHWGDRISRSFKVTELDGLGDMDTKLDKIPQWQTKWSQKHLIADSVGLWTHLVVISLDPKCILRWILSSWQNSHNDFLEGGVNHYGRKSHIEGIETAPSQPRQ